MPEIVRDFGNLPWSHADAREYAAKKGGRVFYDEQAKSWCVRVWKRPRGMTREDACWL